MNVGFGIYVVLCLLIFGVGLSVAIKHGGSATPFTTHEATVPNFAIGGFLFGTVLLYLLGVETPFNMGAEFLSVRSSATRMIAWGSAALVDRSTWSRRSARARAADRRDRRRDRRDRGMLGRPGCPG